MEYFDWHGTRLFRRDPSTNKEERWDKSANGWVDVEGFVTEEFDYDPDPRMKPLDEAAAKAAYPEAFEAGVASIVEGVEDNEGAEGDSRFNALTVADMSRVQSYIMGGKTIEDYLAGRGLDPESIEADQARLYASEIQADYDALTPEQTLDAPGEWT